MDDAVLRTRGGADINVQDRAVRFGRLAPPSSIKTARQAQQSLNITDGIEAGRPWGRFVALFEGRIR